jgi:hypothetical protein
MSYKMTPLWKISTMWFSPPPFNDRTTMSFNYKNWKDFIECRPHRMWKPYVMTSWSWKDDKLQFIFNTPYKSGISISYVEIPVTEADEPEVRAWIKRHMPEFWII